MSVNTVKEVRIKNTNGTYSSQPVGAEGQYVEISRDANGDIIEDITAAGVVVDSTEGLTETLKNLEESVAGSNEFSEMTDVDFTSLADKNLVQYDSTAAKWKNIAMDSTPTASSNKPVTSGGIKTELDKKLNDYANGTSAWDTTPTASSNKPVTSGGIKTALDLKTNDADLKAVAKSGDASDVDYTNTTSGLAATKVQAAIDEVAAENQTLTNNLSDEVETRAKLGAHNLVDINGFTLIKSSARTKYIYPSNIINGAIPSEQVVISFKVTNSNLSKSDNSFKAYGSNGEIGAVSFKANGRYSFVFDGASFNNFYIFISSNAESDETCTISEIMITLASDKSTEFAPYAKTNRELTTENEALTNEVDTIVNEFSVKNIAQVELAEQTLQGVALSIVDNAVVKMNGNATASSARSNVWKAHLKPGTYIVSIDVISGSHDTSKTIWFEKNSGTTGINPDITITTETHKEKEFIVETEGDYHFQIGFQNGDIFNNFVVGYMIRYASIKDGTFVPYAMTNRELAEKVSPLAYSNVKGVEFQVTGNRLLISLYTDDAKSNGLRIDFNGNDNVIQLNTIIDGTMSGHNRVSFPVIT